MAHFDQFTAFFLSNKYNIIAVSETWLRLTLVDVIYSIPGYTIIRCDRRGRIAGGVCLYVKSYYDVKLVLYSNSSPCTTKIEFLFAEVTETSCRKLLLGVVYRLPGIPFTDFDSILSNATDKYFDKLIFGDWSTVLCNASPDTIHLKHLLDAFGLQILNSSPTHHLNRTSTLLDLCLVDDTLRASELHQFVIPFLLKHNLIGLRFSMQLNKLKSKTIHRRNHNNIDPESINNSFSLVDWQALPYNSNLDLSVDTVNAFLNRLLDQNAPLVSHNRRSLMKSRNFAENTRMVEIQILLININVFVTKANLLSG